MDLGGTPHSAPQLQCGFVRTLRLPLSSAILPTNKGYHFVGDKEDVSRLILAATVNISLPAPQGMLCPGSSLVFPARLSGFLKKSFQNGVNVPISVPPRSFTRSVSPRSVFSNFYKRADSCLANTQQTLHQAGRFPSPSLPAGAGVPAGL